MRFFSPGAIRSRRVVGCTMTIISGPESGVSVMEVPLIALIAPMRRADAGAACAGEAGGTADAAASGELTVLAARNKLDKISAGRIVGGKFLDRMDVRFSLIRPLLIYMRWWRLSG